MLRAALLRSRPLLAGSAHLRAGPQLQATRQAMRLPTHQFGQRFYADQKKPDETTIPGSVKNDVPAAPSTSSASPEPPKSPKLPPSPEQTTASTTPPTETGTASTASTPPPPKPKKKGRIRRLFRNLLLLSILGYGGGVYYSLINDNFHDVFTEYVPYAEDVVGYFEERAFQKRFPGRELPGSRLRQQVSGENKVTIPGRSGMSWTVKAEDEQKGGSDLRSKGKHTSALDDTKKSTGSAAKASDEKTTTHEILPKESKPTPPPEKKPEPKAPEATKSSPSAPIDHVNVPGASESAVQDIVKILNDIITTVNADGSSGKFASVIDKAKQDVVKVAEDISTLKATQEKSAEDRIKAAHGEFDEAAKELVRRLDTEMRDQETRWKEEYEAERERLSASYQSKIENELKETAKLYDQKLENELAAQSIALQQQFADTIRAKVEAERDGRLGHLAELDTSVQELQKLTKEWNSVVDANLQTQHLHVALEAVRDLIEHAARPVPFVSELAAIKEVSGDNQTVAAAIASINPLAYQRGIPTPAMLVERFRRVANEVRKAALLPEDAGVASHLASVALSKVMFKKEGYPAGQDVESILTRTEAFLEEGEFDAAAREVNQLQGWAKVLTGDWLTDLRRVCEVKQALDVISTEARLQSLLVD